jgi:hypothetical protein
MYMTGCGPAGAAAGAAGAAGAGVAAVWQADKINANIIKTDSILTVRFIFSSPFLVNVRDDVGRFGDVGSSNRVLPAIGSSLIIYRVNLRSDPARSLRCADFLRRVDI